MRYVIVIFTLACIIIWDGMFNGGLWLNSFFLNLRYLMSYFGV